MTNRKLSSPILSALVLSLAANFPLPSKAAGDVSATTSPPTPASTATTATPIVSSASVTASTAPHTTSYTVVEGDSLTSIANKFSTTRKNLRKLNGLSASTVKVKPGQILQVPSLTTASTAAKKKARHALAAQPVQDFDVPASTFASCPVPLPTPDDDSIPGAPIAKLVSPAEMEAETPPVTIAPPQSVPRAPETPIAPAPSSPNKFVAKKVPAPLPIVAHTMPAFNPPTPHLTSRSLNQASNSSLTSSSSPMLNVSANDWGNRFLQQARALGNQGIEYDDDWRPPGESRSWTMDCSNTTRYLYKVTTGLQLPRTASDQYYYLHLQGKAWDVPLIAEGLPDTEFLRHNLKPGDLLFWENTYRPERQPPITHVMVFLGTNARGEWIMAGSQSSRGGEHNRRNGGPDVYVFRPSQPCGGYSTWMGMVHHKGRFCAFGRPLEADPTKLSVAENN